MKEKHPMLLLIFFLAYILRISVAIFASLDPNVELGDISTVKNWSGDLLQNGFAGFYERGQFFPYPPLANYIFYFLAFIIKVFNFSPNSVLAGVIYRLPNIFADLFIGWILYLLTQKKSLWISVIYLFTPAVWYISSYWGQWDSIMTMFLVISFYLAISQKVLLSFLFWLLAFLIKPQALPFIFPLLGMHWESKKLTRVLLSSLAALGSFLFLYYPFFPDDPFFGPVSYLQKNLVSFAPRFTSSGFNFWYLLYGGWQNDFPEILSVSVEKWSRLITLVLLAVSFYGAKKAKNLFRQALSWALAGWSFFLFFTQVKERYFFAALPFLILGLVGTKMKYGYWLIILVSLLFAVNSIGFFDGWVNHGYWNSTLLSVYNLDKTIAFLYLLSFLYLLFRYVKQK